MEQIAQALRHDDLRPIAGLLAGHPWVAGAQAVARPGISGLIVAPTDPGLQAYRCLGRAGISAVWEAHLGAPMPDLWRLVDALPADSGSAINTNAAALLLEPLANLPAEGEVLINPGGAVEYALRVPLELAIFRTHFPVAPIVPGVEQVRWAVTFSLRHFTLPGKFYGLDMLRFRHVIQPGSALRLTLRLVTGSVGLHFSFRSVGRSKTPRISDGRILFRDADSSLRKLP